jgi:hypothetical protein
MQDAPLAQVVAVCGVSAPRDNRTILDALGAERAVQDVPSTAAGSAVEESLASPEMAPTTRRRLSGAGLQLHRAR